MATSTSPEIVLMSCPAVVTLEEGGASKSGRLSPNYGRPDSVMSEEVGKNDRGTMPEELEGKAGATPKKESEMVYSDDGDFKIPTKRFRVPTKAESGPVSLAGFLLCAAPQALGGNRSIKCTSV